jgi:hypothetical protein
MQVLKILVGGRGWGLGGRPVWAYGVNQDAPTPFHPNGLLRGNSAGGPGGLSQNAPGSLRPPNSTM